MTTRRRDIRAERQARDLAKRFGWGAPMPGDEPDDHVDDEPAQDYRALHDLLDEARRPAAPTT